MLGSALCVRLRPGLPRSDRSMLVAVRPIHVGAVVETAVALTILATMSDLKASILAKDPHDTQAQSHAEVAGSLEPLVVATGTAVGFRLRMAWANSCGRRWPGPCSRSSSARTPIAWSTGSPTARRCTPGMTSP